MKQITGFGKWRITDRDQVIFCEEYGIINMDDKLFIITDENRVPRGKVINLLHFSSWEILEEDDL